MKKYSYFVTLLVIIFFLCGCASSFGQYQNIFNATYDHRDLRGMSKAEVEAMFGKDYRYSVTHGGLGTMETLTYCWSTPQGDRLIIIFLTNDIVTNVTYPQ